jgi:hypothetical protein
MDVGAASDIHRANPQLTRRSQVPRFPADMDAGAQNHLRSAGLFTTRK